MYTKLHDNNRSLTVTNSCPTGYRNGNKNEMSIDIELGINLNFSKSKQFLTWQQSQGKFLPRI